MPHGKLFKKIDLGLLIEKPNIILTWDATKNEIHNLNTEIKIINENYYILKVRMFDIPFIDDLGIQFTNNKISKIVLYLKHETQDENLPISFRYNQNILEKSFGKPSKQFIIEKFFTRVNKGDEELKWQFKKIILTHKIWDRFGL